MGKVWYKFLDVLAASRDKSVLRVAQSVSTLDLGYVLLHLQQDDESTDDPAAHDYFALKALRHDEWPPAMEGVVHEITALKIEQVDMTDVQEAAVAEDVEADGDEGDRMRAVEALAAACKLPTQKQQEGPSVFVDAPVVDEQHGQAIREDTPGYIPMAFPKLFPYGTGDYHDLARHDLQGKFSFDEWGRHVLQWHDGRFMRHTRFRYWFLNTWLRMKTPGIRDLYWRNHEDAQDLTMGDLADMSLRKKVVQQMTTISSNLPGSLGERRTMRRDLEAFVDQKESETLGMGRAAAPGRLPCGFATFTTNIYKWESLHKLILSSYSAEERRQFETWQQMPLGDERDKAKRKAFYEAAVSNPEAVSWYAALRLEATLHLACSILSRQLQSEGVPGKDLAIAALQRELARAFGADDAGDVVDVDVPDNWGEVDDYWGTFEWSGGGMLHIHVALWISGSPRIDKVVHSKAARAGGAADQADGSNTVVSETVWADEGDVCLSDDSAANALTAFFQRVYSEWNIIKRDCGEATRVGPRRKGAWTTSCTSPDMMSSVLKSWLLASDSTAPSADVRAELQELAEASNGQRYWADIAEMLFSAAPEERMRGKVQCRLLLVGMLAEWLQMHDLHEPFAMGPPSKSQACCKVENDMTSQERCECGKLFPRCLLDAGCGRRSKNDPYIKNLSNRNAEAFICLGI